MSESKSRLSTAAVDSASQRGTRPSAPRLDWGEIERLVAVGESDTLEFKRTTGELKSAGSTLAAFLNGGRGGIVLFGVSPEGRVRGQNVSDATRREISETIAAFEPRIHLARFEEVEVPDAAGRRVILLEVAANAPHAPYLFDGRPYVRVSSTTRVMPRERMLELLRNSARTSQRWELEPAEGYDLTDLDAEEIRRIARQGVASGRLTSDLAVDDVADVLDKLHLLDDGRPIAAAVALFARDVLPRYPQCQIHMARFVGGDKRVIADEQPPLHANVFRQVRAAEAFFRKHLWRGAFVVGGKGERVERWSLPLDALREAIHNAVCHRDYEHRGGSVFVELYDDRLEIANIGRLPEGWTPDDLKRRHRSRPPNAILARVLYVAGLIEEWGRGTEEIVRRCVEEGHQEPVFIAEGGDVVVRFVPSSPFGGTAPNATAEVLTGHQRQLLQVLQRAERPLSLKDILAALPQTKPAPAPRTIRHRLSTLRELRLASLSGVGAGARWALTPKGTRRLEDESPTGGALVNATPLGQE
jgi:ATP-dependent DNA helicase RecG